MRRAELDALLIEEQTGIPFASTNPGKMHACGHDLHMECLWAATDLLVNARPEWTGTLVLFQPNEEHTGSARAMVDNYLYKRMSKPNAVMAQYMLQIPSGSISVKGGPVLVSADAVRVRIFFKRGAHRQSADLRRHHRRG